MHAVRRGWRTLFVAGLVALALAGTVRADQAAVDKTIADTLRDVHNRGADLYNGGDPSGCYRMFQGALMTVRPLLGHHPEVQKDIEKALAEADRQPDMARRAFALHTTIEGVRAKLKGGGAATAEPKPPMPGGAPAPAAAPKPPEPKPATPTLWERLGGLMTVRKVVDDFVAAAVADPKVDFTRGGKYKINEADLKFKLVQQISEASGGPLKYVGKNMKEAHQGMGITDAQFDALAVHLVSALKKHGAKQEDIDAVVKVVAGTRKDIVEAPKPEAKPPEPKPEEKKPPETAEIKGKVSFDGKPLPGGTITFTAANGNVPHKADIGADGSFTVKDLPPGEYRVAVTGKGVQLPAKFAEADKSGLVYSAVKGAQTFDIDLKS